jgi:hypothetical protein
VAKTGPGGIAAMTGTTPGVGDITFYALGDQLTEQGADQASHIGIGTAPDGPVSPDAWIVVVRCDGRWLVIYEICSA